MRSPADFGRLVADETEKSAKVILVANHQTGVSRERPGRAGRAEVAPAEALRGGNRHRGASNQDRD